MVKVSSPPKTENNGSHKKRQREKSSTQEQRKKAKLNTVQRQTSTKEEKVNQGHYLLRTRSNGTKRPTGGKDGELTTSEKKKKTNSNEGKRQAATKGKKGNQGYSVSNTRSNDITKPKGNLVSYASTSSSAVSQDDEEPEEFFMSRSASGVEGRRFERLMIGIILLALSEEKEFALSAEDVKYPGFDDIVVRVKSKDNKEKIYAIQLKYGENEKNWKWAGNKKYFAHCEKLEKTYGKQVEMILFTNRDFTRSESKIDLGKRKKIIVIKHDNGVQLKRFLHLFAKSTFYKFIPEEYKDTNNNNNENNVYEKLYFCTDSTKNNDAIEEKITGYFCNKYKWPKQDLKNCVTNYINFIYKWHFDSGEKRKLKKHFMCQVLALCFFLFDIKWLSFPATTWQSDKQKTFKKAILMFDEISLSEKHYDSVKSLWAGANFEKKEIQILKKYQQLNSRLLKNETQIDADKTDTLLKELDDEKKSLALWLTDRCPLILPEKEITRNGRELWNNKKYIFLQKTDEINGNTLNDLKTKSPDLYKSILRNFTCTLQDKLEISLEDLIDQNDEITEIITMNVLAKLLENLLIGNEKQKLPEQFEEPSISRIIMQDEILEKIDEDTVIVISNVKNEKKIKCLSYKSGVEVKNLNETLEEDSPQLEEKSRLILVTEESCDEKKFEKVLKRFPKKTSHHLRINEQELEWIRSKNSIHPLRKYFTKPDFVDYRQCSYKNERNNINIVYAEPGRGKTTFLKYLINTTLPSYWGLLVKVDHFFSSGEKDFNKYIKEQYPEHFDRQLLEALLKEGRIVYCWDALSKENWQATKKIIKSISENEKTEHWITCTNDLKNDLENYFNVLAKPLKSFDNKEEVYFEDIEGKKPIHYACKNNEYERVKQLVEQDETCLNYKDKEGRLPIHYASKSEEIMKLLIENGSQLDVSDNGLKMPIHYACTEGHIEVVKLLIKNNVVLNEPDDSGERPIHEACNRSHHEIVKLLLKEDIKLHTDVEAGKKLMRKYCEIGLETIIELLVKQDSRLTEFGDEDEKEPIHYACEKGLFKIVKLLLDKNVNLNVRDKSGKTPLHGACRIGQEEIVKLLLKDFKIKDNEFVNDILLCAIDTRFYKTESHSNEEVLVREADTVTLRKQPGQRPKIMKRYRIVKLLLEKGADVNAIDKKGQSVIHKILKRKRNRTDLKYEADAILKLLMDKGAPIDFTDKKNRKPIHYASFFGYFEIVQMFINKMKKSKSAELNVADGDNNMPLHSACRKGFYKTAQILIDNEANLEVKDKDGKTAIHHACCRGNYKIVQLLIAKKTNVNVKDNAGKIPLHYACDKGVFKIVELLIENNAELDVQDNDGKMAIHYASAGGYYKIVELLMTRGAKLNEQDRSGQTPRDLADENGHDDVAQLIS